MGISAVGPERREPDWESITGVLDVGGSRFGVEVGI